jgi:hypothetical protein
VAKSTSALLSASLAMMGLWAAVVASFYWKELHVGMDGLYLV